MESLLVVQLRNQPVRVTNLWTPWPNLYVEHNHL